MEQFQKYITYTIIKINFDNGENLIFASKAPWLTEMKLKEAIEKQTALPNFVHEVYAVENGIKTFTIEILEDNVPAKQYKQKVALYSKKFGSVKQTMKYDENWCFNRIMDAFTNKSIFIDADKIEYVKRKIAGVDEHVLRVIGNFVYRYKTWEEFKNDINNLE